MRRIGLTLLICSAACSGGVDLTGDGDHDALDAVPADARDEATADGPADAPIDEASGEDDAGEAVDDGGAGCASMDARGDGSCDMELPGIAWNGERCAPLGSGCACVGADCARLYETIEECVADRRACYPDVGCTVQPAALGSCVFCAEPMYLGAFWDGRACFELVGCECAGAGCAGGFPSLAECEAYHAGCDGTLCEATGGQWFPASVGLCGFACGVPAERDCFAPMDSCRCAPGETFASGTGCVPVSGCDARELCVGTHGAWHPASECYCGFSCGSPGACGACLDSCDCGPYRNFEGARGCRFDEVCLTDADPPSPPPAELCAGTGGTWDDCADGCSCGDYHCGVPNLLDPCVMPGCDCGPYANFDTLEGCVWDDACVLREVGESCTGYGLGASTCRPGLACCASCGAMPGCLACANPCCGSGDPLCDTTGCLPPPP